MRGALLRLRAITEGKNRKQAGSTIGSPPNSAKSFRTYLLAKVMILLKNKPGGFYCKTFGVWTSDPLDAFAFPDAWSARHFLRCTRVQDVQIVEPEVTTPELGLAA
jgi:hypothetical protein